MSDYMAAQQSYSFDYQSSLEIATPYMEKLEFVSSGKVSIVHSDKIHVTRTGGFANVELGFDGTTLTVLGRNLDGSFCLRRHQGDGRR